MSDFFMPKNETVWDKYNNKTQNEVQTTQNEHINAWNKAAPNFEQNKKQHYENWNRYGVDVPDEWYAVFNQVLSQCETPELAQEEAYKFGSAIKYMEMMNIPFEEAYKNVDSYNAAQFTDKQGQKEWYEAICDMFNMGKNNVELGKLGNKLMAAQRDGDTELAEALMAEIGAIQQQNILLQDNTPRDWKMECAKAGAVSLPFTGYVAIAGLIGNFIAPGVGTGAAFIASSYLGAGQEYIDMLANGATPETARTISLISGGIQGLIEADLGITASIVKNGAKIMGKEVAENAAKKAVEEIGQKFFKRFHFGPGKKLLLNFFTNYAKGIPGEVAEEGLQEITSVIGQEVAAAMDGYDIPDDDAKHIVKQIMEAAKGGLMGAMSLGIFSSGLSTAVEIKDFKKMQKAAEVTDSPEAFYNENKDNPIFSGMAEPEAKAMSREVWDRVQKRKEEALNEVAKEILETTDFGEGAEERTVNEESEEEPVNAVARNEEGRLDIQDDETTNEDGTISGNFRTGDRTKKENNRYGYINYTADEKNKTVKIDDFVMVNGREGLRGELFDEFSRKYAGYKVEWNTRSPAAQAIKESLIENNPNGKKGGLSYYSDEDLSDIQTRKRVAAELKQNIYSIEQVTDANGNVSYVKKELSNKQVAAGIALLESAAKRMGMSLSNYVDKTFSSRIFATEKEFEDAVAAQGDTTTGKAGAMEWKRFGQEVKAVIYAGENADFSTWVHELAHVFQSQLTGDLKAQAEKAFNVIDGDWINSKFTFADGHTDSAAEAFAYGFQDWLKTGRAESEELKNIFQKFAEFLARAFNALKKHINFTPEIESVYNQLLAGDDSILAKAEKAVEEEDRSYRAKMKADKEAKTAAAQKEAEDAKKAEAAEREEKSEVTEYAEEKADEVAEAEKKLDEVTNEESEENVSAVDNALKDLNLTDEKKEEVAEILKNPDETQQAKASAIVDAASESAYGEDEDESFESLGDMLFQKSKIIPIGKGDFGNIYDCFKGQPNQAIAFLISQQGGEAIGALHHKDIGDIDLVWGEEGTGHSDGYGLSKLAKYHPEVLANLQEILDSMTVTDRSKNRVQLESKTHKAGVRLTWNGKNKNWLLTAFEKDSDVSDSRTDIAGTENGSKNDTATLANTANNDNTTTNENVNKTLFQIAGEIGAANLDNSEEVKEGVSRMQNLAIAKEMEADGKDAKTIRLATGWEKGNDGKWRYEIDDSNVKLYDEQLFPKRHLDKDEEYERIEKEIKAADYDIEAIPVQDLQYWESVNDSESDFIREYINFDGGKTKWKKTADLERILYAPELFKAYPQLKKIQFYTEKLPSGYLGRFESMKNRIVLDPMAGLSTLLHEIQHAIQEIEGFAKGGTSQQFENKQIAELEDEIRGHHNNIDLWNKDIKLEDFVEKSMREVAAGKKDMSKHWQDLEEYVNNSEYAKEINAEKKRIKELEEQIDVIKAETTDNRSAEQKYNALAGEVESRNVETRRKFTQAERINTLLKETEDVAPKDKIILFQTVYHGSPHNFEAFSTENIGSGEGAQAFGWGLYFTNQESIARFYADKLANEPARISLISKNDFLKSRKKSLKDVENKEKYEARIYKNINHFNKELKQAQKAKDESEIKFYQGLIDDSVKQLDEKERLSLVEAFKKDIEKTEQEIAELKASMKKNRNLYTVDIPDEGYLQWDKHVSLENIEGIKAALKDRGVTDFSRLDNLIENQEKWKDNPNATYTLGGNIYKVISDYLGGDKAASLFLKDLGYIGIDYPAHSLSGYTSEDERNYVIFNDDDAKIIDHLLFQTQEELYKDARDFDNWQDFMEFYESFGKPENSLVPFDADAQWYQSTWEMAHGVKTEQEQNEEKANARREKESVTADAMDALFMTALRSQPEMLDRFLTMVSKIDATDLEEEEWQNIDESGAEARDWYERMKDFISFSLSDYNWQTAMRRVRSGNEISEGLRKRLLGEMTDPLKVRDFRAIYAEVMEDEQYAVDPQDTVAARLSEKLNKYAKKYHDIVKPGEDISRASPERRKQIAQEMANRVIAAKIANGSLKLDDELDAYIKSLTGQTKKAQQELEELEKETKADYQRIADAERRKLLKLHEELLLARNRMTKRNSEIERKIAKGLKVTEKYQRETQNMGASYNELFRKYKDLENSIELTAEVKEAITRQERYVELKEDLNNQKKEKSLAEEVKKMRIQLVKRTMRRVPFNRIDYENAKTVIAIQRMLEPNLMGGVNRFIGIDSPFLRGVISQLLTDSDYKQKILNYLSKSQKSSKAFVDFKNKIENMKSIKEFDEWTRKEREYAIKHLPKENWVKELNLEQLAKEREESIDLDISVEEKPQVVYDEKTGEPKQYKDADGQMHIVTVPVGHTVYSDEIGRRVIEAIGADMFDKIVNLSFAEWTTEDLEQLAKRIDELYVEGRELLAAKNEARKREAERLRKQVEDAIKETGITINDDDTPEEKEAKINKINKILGMTSDLKGTEAGKESGLKAKLNRLLHGYSDMNLLRFARMFDNQSEGVNTYLLYRKEDECFNAKQRSITSRADTVRKVMQDNNITEADLAEVVRVAGLETSFTVDELLYFLAADKDYEEDEKKLAKGEIGIDANDDFAATSRNAVMFGNMMSDNASQEQKEAWDQMDKNMADALENDALTTEQKQLLAIGQLDKTPGTTAYINECHAKWNATLAAANSFLNENPKFKALMEAIEADYAAQYERMNEVSINEFNTPVHRVKAYVPLVRKESNGEANVNQVKEDLLGAYGAAGGKQWVNKGMTQRRQNIAPLHQKPVQTGLFNTWASSIERTEHFIAYAPYVRQLNAIYKSRDAAYTRRFIEARYGKAAVEYLDNYINEVANPKAGKIREKGAEFLHTLRGRTAPAYLGWKLSGVVKQALTSPWPYMQFVNPAEYAAACFECLNPEKKAYDAIKEKSVFMRTRSFDPIKDLIDEVSENAKSKLDRNWSKFTAMGMQGLEWIDWACVAPGWLACYKKKYNLLQKASEARYQAKVAELTEKNMAAEVATSDWLSPDQIKQKASQEVMDDIEMEAITYADDCTRQCQPSSRLTDLAPLFKNSSEAMKAFLQFQTSLNVIWQNIRYDIPYAVRQKEFERIAGGIIGYVMAGIFMNSVMDGLMEDDGEDRKELQALRNLIFYSTTQFTDAIPMIGSEITNTMDMLITGKRNFSQSGTDMTPSATKILNALTKATKGDFKKAAALTAEGIGLGLGAPVSGTKEIYKLLGKPFKEGDVNLKRGVGDVYGLAGDILGE